MTSKTEKDKQKLVQERCQQFLTDLLKDEDNKYCVDCDAKGLSGRRTRRSSPDPMFPLIVSRSAMGFVESGGLSLHQMRRHSPQSGSPHLGT